MKSFLPRVTPSALRSYATSPLYPTPLHKSAQFPFSARVMGRYKGNPRKSRIPMDLRLSASKPVPQWEV